MLRLRRFALAGCALALCALFVRAQEPDLKAVLRKAIDAHGGEKALTKFQAGNSKYKGKMNLMGAERDISAEIAFQKPDKMRNTMTIDFDGKAIEIVSVYDGKTLWVSVAGKTQEITDENILKEVREGLLSEGGGMLEFLKAPYELAALGEVKVKDKDTIGVRVSKKGLRDINYYFDKKTNLLAKIETRTVDPATSQEVTQEKFVLEYQEKDGLKVGKRLEILKDGNPYMSIEISDVRVLEKLDDSLFAMP